jgi:hypothetical protein
VGLIATAFLAWYLNRGRGPAAAAVIPGDQGPAVTVEVLNGTEIGGLARDVTKRLRSRGIDVVYFGSSGERRDSTVILIRRGDSTAAVAVRKALGTGRIAVALDPNRLLDASVVVGRDVAASLDSHP